MVLPVTARMRHSRNRMIQARVLSRRSKVDRHEAHLRASAPLPPAPPAPRARGRALSQSATSRSLQAPSSPSSNPASALPPPRLPRAASLRSPAPSSLPAGATAQLSLHLTRPPSLSPTSLPPLAPSSPPPAAAAASGGLQARCLSPDRGEEQEEQAHEHVSSGLLPAMAEDDGRRVTCSTMKSGCHAVCFIPGPAIRAVGAGHRVARA
eukprot:3731101-Rhodomonas_salina.3